MLSFLLAFVFGVYIGTYYNCLPMIQFFSKVIRDHLPREPPKRNIHELNKKRKKDHDGVIEMK